MKSIKQASKRIKSVLSEKHSTKSNICNLFYNTQQKAVLVTYTLIHQIGTCEHDNFPVVGAVVTHSLPLGLGLGATTPGTSAQVVHFVGFQIVGVFQYLVVAALICGV